MHILSLILLGNKSKTEKAFAVLINYYSLCRLLFCCCCRRRLLYCFAAAHPQRSVTCLRRWEEGWRGYWARTFKGSGYQVVKDWKWELRQNNTAANKRFSQRQSEAGGLWRKRETVQMNDSSTLVTSDLATEKYNLMMDGDTCVLRRLTCWISNIEPCFFFLFSVCFFFFKACFTCFSSLTLHSISAQLPDWIAEGEDSESCSRTADPFIHIMRAGSHTYTQWFIQTLGTRGCAVVNNVGA